MDAMSRRAGSSPLGKRTAILRTMTDPLTKEMFAAKATKHGMTESEAVEFVCQVWVYGIKRFVNMHAERLERAAIIGQE